MSDALSLTIALKRQKTNKKLYWPNKNANDYMENDDSGQKK